MKTPTIAKELSDLPHLPVAELLPLQGDLKELSERNYNKLKKSLIENGVIVPFFVWLEAGKLLDGHQRQRVFIRENWLMDVPVVYVSAATEQEAKQKLLAISSQFGQITQEGFDAFTFDLSDEWIQESVHFDALPFVFGDFQPTDPANDPYAEWEGMPEYEQENATGAILSLKVHFSSQDDINRFGQLVSQAINEHTTYIWFPKQEKLNLKDHYKVVDE